MINEKEKYYEFINNLTNNELVREIYFEENISILNIAEKFYMANFIEDKTQKNQYITGFIVDHKTVNYISKGLKNYYKMIKSLGKDAEFMELNPKNIEAIKLLKNDSIQNGPSKYISHEMEEKLMNIMKERQGRGR